MLTTKREVMKQAEQNSKSYTMYFEPIKTRTLIPKVKNQNVYIDDLYSILFNWDVNMGLDKLYLRLDGNILYASPVRRKGFELCRVIGADDGKVRYKMPKAFLAHKNDLIVFTSSGVIDGCFIINVSFIERGKSPKSLLERFIANSADLCCLGACLGEDEIDGDWRVTDNHPVKSYLYLKNQLVCTRNFNFKDNSCTFIYHTVDYDALMKISEAYKCLRYDNKHTYEFFDKQVENDAEESTKETDGNGNGYDREDSY